MKPKSLCVPRKNLCASAVISDFRYILYGLRVALKGRTLPAKDERAGRAAVGGGCPRLR